MSAFNVHTSDSAVFSGIAYTPTAHASDGATFGDHLSATRLLSVAASDHASFSASGLPQSPAADSATFTDTASILSDLGRFRRGDWAPLSLSVASRPDGPPIAVILDGSMSQVAAIPMPSTTADMLNYLLPIQISLTYSVGTYSVFYHYLIAGQSVMQQATLDVIAGGDSGGAVISMYSVDRQEVRSIVAQLDSGILVLGRSPTVKD